jgi:hypothetical protein
VRTEVDNASRLSALMTAAQTQEALAGARLSEAARAQQALMAPVKLWYDEWQRQASIVSDLATSFRVVQANLTSPLSDFAQFKGLTASSLAYETLFRDAAANALGSWRHVLDQSTVEAVTASLTEQAQADPNTHLLDAVTIAVTNVLRERDVHTDWRFVLSLILGLLFFLCADIRSTDAIEHAAERTDARLERIEKAEESNNAELKRLGREIERRLLLQDEVIGALATTEVERRARVFSRPSSKSRQIGFAEAGTRVIVTERRREWVRVAVRRRFDDEASDADAAVGWMLKKYLSSARRW